MRTLAFLIGVLWLLGMPPGSAVAEIPGERIAQVTEFVTSARVTLASAIWAASQEHPRATPFRAEISPIRPTHAYSVLLLTETGVVRCDVDACCGGVLDSDDLQVEVIDKLRRVVRRTKVPLTEAAGFAERQTRAVPFRAALRSAGGKTRAVVELISQGRVIEVPVDRVLSSEPVIFVKAH
ncbi:MAG: hypothetical protein ACT4QC_08065 [Planctomycetaceae bacterium]